MVNNNKLWPTQLKNDPLVSNAQFAQFAHSLTAQKLKETKKYTEIRAPENRREEKEGGSLKPTFREITVALLQCSQAAVCTELDFEQKLSGNNLVIDISTITLNNGETNFDLC